jgi:hypothetical protein
VQWFICRCIFYLHAGIGGNMPGFIVFTTILFVYGFILSHGIFSLLLPGKKALHDTIEDLTVNNKKRILLSVVAIIVGVWNLFAPDFGAKNSLTIIGALVPSVVMICDGLIICPELVGFINISKKSKKKFIKKINGYKKFAGPITLVAAILHIIYFRSVFF